MPNVKLEICCGGINDVKLLKDLPIGRIELNCATEIGGLTPSIATLKAAKALTSIPIVCMVRPRTGNFIYTKEELAVMYEEAENLIANGADGIVCGILGDDYRIDSEAMKKMRQIARDKELIFHRAMDDIEDKAEACEELIAIGVDRILLMGLESEDFLDCLKRTAHLNDSFGHRIEFEPGGGINEDNILDVIKMTKAQNIHGSFKEVVEDPISHSRYNRTSYERIIKVLKILKRI